MEQEHSPVEEHVADGGGFVEGVVVGQLVLGPKPSMRRGRAMCMRVSTMFFQMRLEGGVVAVDAGRGADVGHAGVEVGRADGVADGADCSATGWCCWA